MTQNSQREFALEVIRENIARSGHHIYVVSGGGQTPRFAYTVGDCKSIGAELILAGAIYYMKDEIVKIVNDIVAQMKAQSGREIFEVLGQGSFALRQVHASWTKEFLLGAFDYYQKRDIRALQIVPDKAHWTIDVPDMSAPWSAKDEPVWQWLREPWKYPVPENSIATMNLPALRGGRITEVARWEVNEWEIFAGAGPDVRKDEIRVVPLATLLATDGSLAPVLNLEVGTGIWRNVDSDWHPWRKKETSDGAGIDD